MRIQAQGSMTLLVFLVAALMGPGAASLQAESSPTAVTSPMPESAEATFLELPTHDLEPETAPLEGIVVGDRVKLKVSAWSGESAGVTVTAPPGISLMSDHGWELLEPAGLSFTAVPVKAGTTVIPSLLVKDADGRPIARTNPLTVEVSSAIKGGDAQPVELKPPVSLPFPWWAVVVLAVFALSLIAALVYALVRWSRRAGKIEPVTAPAAPPPPEDEIALLALAELEKQGLSREGNHKAHYFKASEILKSYVGARYGFDATESTTSELLSEMERNRRVTDEQMDRIEALFERLDRVKFSDHVPAPDDSLSLVGDIRQWVVATRRPRVAESEGVRRNAV